MKLIAVIFGHFRLRTLAAVSRRQLSCPRMTQMIQVGLLAAVSRRYLSLSRITQIIQAGWLLEDAHQLLTESIRSGECPILPDLFVMPPS